MHTAYTVLCCHLWPLRLYNIFTHYIISGVFFEKKTYRNKMLDFDFSTNLSETFLILIRTERDMIINVHKIQK
jgi:hypothetical protein